MLAVLAHKTIIYVVVLRHVNSIILDETSSDTVYTCRRTYTRVLACPAYSTVNDRVMFLKGTTPEEVIEEFVQTIVVVLERDASLQEVALSIMIKMMCISNNGIGERLMIQVKDLLTASVSMGELGGPLLINTPWLGPRRF